jgi:hypothetical protein
MNIHAQIKNRIIEVLRTLPEGHNTKNLDTFETPPPLGDPGPSPNPKYIRRPIYVEMISERTTPDQVKAFHARVASAIENDATLAAICQGGGVRFHKSLCKAQIMFMCEYPRAA